MTAFNLRVVGLVPRVALLAALLLGGLGAGLAGRGALAHAGHGMPARLHQGTCEAIGPVAFELNGVGAVEDLEGNGIPEPELLGAPTAAEVQVSVTTVAASLEAIASGGHALKVYQSDDAMDVAVACGDVGGIVVEGDLVVGLAAAGEEGMSGVAIFHPEADQTVVRLVLTPTGHEHEATPSA